MKANNSLFLTNMKEIWKEIEEYKGMYAVSNYGRVKSIARYIECKDKRKVFYKEHYMALGETKN